MDKSGYVNPVKFETGGGRSEFHLGITKREYFAAMAMQGMLANFGAHDPKEMVAEAIACADALVEAL